MRNLKSLLMKIEDESILFFSRVSLSKFSLEVLFLSWVKWVSILGWEWNVKSQVFQNKAGSRLGLTTWLNRDFQPRRNWMANCLILSCSAPAGMTLQLLACLVRVQLQAACSHESPARSSCESLFFLHTLKHFFTLSHSLPLQESHLNTRLLIAEIQANLAQNKANKMIDKIQPYSMIGFSNNIFKLNDLTMPCNENKIFVERCEVNYPEGNLIFATCVNENSSHSFCFCFRALTAVVLYWYIGIF